MCQASIEGRKTRDAEQGETVYAVKDHYGAFATQPNVSIWVPKTLVCVRYGQKCTLENLQFRLDVDSRVLRQIKAGQRHVVELARSPARGIYGDRFVFADGVVVPSLYVISPIYVGVKVAAIKLFRGRKQFDHHVLRWPPSKVGVAAIDKAIDEAIATPHAMTRELAD